MGHFLQQDMHESAALDLVLSQMADATSNDPYVA
jgi:hypothetical protein